MGMASLLVSSGWYWFGPRARFRAPGLKPRRDLDVCQALQRFAGIGNHRHFASPGAADGQRVGIDIDQRLRWQHLRIPLHRIALGQSGADDEQDVSLVRADRVNRPG
jgi:hypothetical protein